MVAVGAVGATVNAGWLTADGSTAGASLLEGQRVVGWLLSFLVKGGGAVHVSCDAKRVRAFRVTCPAGKG